MIFNFGKCHLMAALMILSTLIPTYLGAQSKISDSEASASAVVLWAVDVTGVQNLQFDEIVTGEEKVIYLDGSVSGIKRSGQEKPGKFRITTPQSFQVRFKELPSTMEGPRGINMPIEFFAAWSEEQFPSKQQLNMFDINNTLLISSTGSVREIYLFLGARVTPAQSQVLGDYNVQVTLSIIHGI